MTSLRQVTVAELVAASHRFGGFVPDAPACSPDDLPVIDPWGARVALAGVLIEGEAIDGNHRAGGLAAWAGADPERLATLVWVLVTDEQTVVDEIYADKARGGDARAICKRLIDEIAPIAA